MRSLQLGYIIGYFLLFLVLTYLAIVEESYAVIISLLIIKIFFSVWFFSLKSDVLNSYFVFSLMFMGYAIGGVYYTFSDGYYGKFLEFHSLHDDKIVQYMNESLIYCLVFYFLMSIGYLLGKKFSYAKKTCSAVNYDFFKFLHKNRYSLIYPFLLLVAFYWVYVSIVSAGSLYNAIIYFQLFPHFIKESGLSIAPYIILYTLVYMLFMLELVVRKRIGSDVVCVIVFSLVVILSTGRISQAASFFLTLFLFYLFFSKKAREQAIFIFVVIIFVSVLIHFLREMSNYYYLTNDVSIAGEGLFKTIIGGGNISDLQQLIIVRDVFDYTDYEYGRTYFDWINNLIGKYFGLEPRSLGLTIYNAIVPIGSSSGAPTPGALGEMYANFGYWGVILSPVIGFIFSVIDKNAHFSQSPIKKMIYTMYLSFFVFLYPKVDSTMIVNLLWAVIPFLVFCFLYFFVYSVSNHTYE